MLGQRGAQQFEIAQQFIHRGIGRQHLGQLLVTLRQRIGHHRQRGANRAGLLQRALNAGLEADDKTAVVLELVLRTEDLRLRRMHQGDVGIQPLQQRIAHRALLRAGGQQFNDVVEPVLVVEQQMAAREANRVAGDIGRDKWIAIAIAANPRTKVHHQRQIVRLQLQAVGRAQRLRNFAVERGHRGEDGDVVIIEAHLDFVVHCRSARADLVGLPQAGNLGTNQVFKPPQLLLRDRNPVKAGEEVTDAAALGHDRAARHLSRVRGEDRDDMHTAQPVEGFFRADADTLHLAQGACERAALTAGLAAELQGNSPALAVVGLSQVDELEVESEGAGKQDSALDRQRVHQLQRLGGVAGRFILVAACLGIAAADSAAAQGLDVLIEVVSGLLTQHLTQQRAKRAHVAAQRGFLQVARAGFKLRQTLRPAFRIPQEGHVLRLCTRGKRAIP